MSLKNALTNEELNERFDNAFALVNYAIALARNSIRRGEDLSQNPINMVLESILENREISDEVSQTGKKSLYADEDQDSF